MRHPRAASQRSTFGRQEQANRKTPVRLDDESVERVAQRVAELLRAAPPVSPPKMVSAAELARAMGVSRDWCYRHAAELGAVRIGDGEKARLRFDLDATVASWVACPSSKRAQEEEAPAKRPVSRRRKRRSAGTGAPLLPIGPEKTRPGRAERSGDATQ